MKLPAKLLISFAVAAALIAPAPALARKASSLSYLEGMRASSGESQLDRMGFTYITGHERRQGKDTFWWHHEDKDCIRVRTYDGRYTEVVDAPSSDCNQKSGGSGAAVAAVAGVALIAALVAASHKSSHHDDDKHSDDLGSEQAYERGYTDGLHSVAYHNADRNDAYARGYEAGVEQRRNNTAHHSGYGGYRAAETVSDLNGVRASSADSQLTSRGFRNVDGFKSGTTSYSIWYNDRTEQCVQMTVADGDATDVRDIHEHPKCR